MRSNEDLSDAIDFLYITVMAIALLLLAHVAAAGEPPQATTKAQIEMERVATAAKASGCGRTVQSHVYNPDRLTIYSRCITVTGTIVDATKGRRSDGVRKEADGDTHGWLKLDPEFHALLNSGNRKHEGGNLVFEIVCFWKPTQHDAISSCPGSYHNAVTLPPVGSRVEISGAFVQDENHQHWMEIHPVTKILALP
jgi:hypothetical protein